MRLEGFSPREEAMVGDALAALQLAGYDVDLVVVLIRADLPKGYRGMSWPEGAVLGAEAFASPTILVHVLEEEFLHLLQRLRGLLKEFEPGTASALEDDADVERKFPLPRA